MILCLDVGNTTIHGGVFQDDFLKMQFRRTSEFRASSDELGLFLKAVLRENDVDPAGIEQIAMCSVVPDAIHSLRGCCSKYFNRTPFILQAGTKTGLKVKYRNPLEVGADRIADAIGATNLFPGKNLIIGDFGTATTFSAVTKDREFLGGAILPGVRLSMEALEEKTAKLPSVEIVAASEALGRSTVESIQSGIYFGQIGVAKELITRITEEVFKDEKPYIVGTGGFSGLFERANLFDAVVPELVLKGLNFALKMNV